VNDAEFVFLNGVGGTHFCARRIFAVHADLHARLRGVVAIDVVNAHHRRLTVCLALGARHFAGVATDATLRVHKELFFLLELEEHVRRGLKKNT
jgi:hypothetical protein